MLCPNCGYADQSMVTDTRMKDGGIRRRRKCLICGHRFSTMELVVPAKMKSKDYIKLIDKMERNENEKL